MAMRITDKHRIAAKLLAQGALRMNEICKEIGIARQTLISWKHKPEFKKLVESCAIPLEDQEGKERELLDQAYITLHKIMKNGTNESAKVNAAKYVVDTFRRKITKSDKNSSGTDMATILRLVDEK
tara:strand:+ start:547 stop:924 length:378 start_codon:yes stop_codon:yes gene_type:complete